MKKIILMLTAVLGLSLTGHAFDLKSILKGATEGAKSETASSIASGLGSILGNLTSTSNFELTSMVGTWKYSSPAVTLQGDNALEQIGGAAAAATIENKLKDYYKKAGVDKLVLTVNEDMTFTMQLKVGKLSGTISRNTDANGNELNDGQLIFNFSAFGSMKIGQIGAYATMSGSQLALTFDVSKLISICEKVASISGSSSFQTLSKLLSSYEGLYAGAKLKKQ